MCRARRIFAVRNARIRAGKLLLCVLVILMGLPGCRSSASAIINYDIPGGVTTLDPQRATDETARMIISNAFEGLLRQLPDGTLQPAAAKSYDVSPDQLTYTFYLREDLLWSNGDKITAHDFAFAVERLFDPVSLSPFAAQFASLQGAQAILEGRDGQSGLGVRVVNDYTLVFQLSRPDNLLPELLASSFAMPCNETFFRSTKARYGLSLENLIFNGPFYVSHWDNSSGILLRANQRYVNAGEVRLLGVNLYINEEQENDPVERFLAGKTDACKMDYSAVAAVTKRGGETQRFEDIVWVLALNLDREAMQNDHLRRAIALSVDRSLFDPLLPDNLRVAHTLIPPSVKVMGHPFREYAGENTPLVFNTALAQREMEQGLAELLAEQIDLQEILVCDDDTQPLLAGMLQRNFERYLALSTGLVRLPKEELIARVQSGDYQAAVFPLSAVYSSPDSILNLFRSDNADNFTGYSARALDALLESTTSMTTQSRLDVYRQAEQLLLADCAVVPLYFETTYYASAKGVSGIGFSPYLSGVVFRDAQKTDG